MQKQILLSILPLLPFALAGTPTSQYSSGGDTYKPASLDITSWTGAGCTGTAIQNPGLNYDYNTEAETQSYNLSRPLAAGEHLDWSGMAAGWARRSLDPYCGAYDHSAKAEQGTECVSFDKTLTCFRLWHD